MDRYLRDLWGEPSLFMPGRVPSECQPVQDPVNCLHLALTDLLQATDPTLGPSSLHLALRLNLSSLFFLSVYFFFCLLLFLPFTTSPHLVPWSNSFSFLPFILSMSHTAKSQFLSLLPFHLVSLTFPSFCTLHSSLSPPLVP